MLARLLDEAEARPHLLAHPGGDSVQLGRDLGGYGRELLVDKLDISIQAPPHLISQAVDLLLEEEKGLVLLLPGADLPKLPGVVPQREENDEEESAEKDDDPEVHKKVPKMP